MDGHEHGSGSPDDATDPAAEEAPHRFDPEAAAVLEETDRFRYPVPSFPQEDIPVPSAPDHPDQDQIFWLYFFRGKTGTF